MSKRTLFSRTAVVAFALLSAASLTVLRAGQVVTPAVLGLAATAAVRTGTILRCRRPATTNMPPRRILPARKMWSAVIWPRPWLVEL